MVDINANGRLESVKGFILSCIDCDSTNVMIYIAGASEFGEVGDIEVICKACGQHEGGE